MASKDTWTGVPTAIAERLDSSPAFRALTAAIIPGAPYSTEVGAAAVYTILGTYHSDYREGGRALPLHVAIQQAVGREFGVKTPLIYSKEQQAAARAKYGKVQPGLRAVYRAVYDHTQEWLAKQHISSLPVYRGMSWAEGRHQASLTYDGKTHEATFHLQPVSSFSVRADIAHSYTQDQGSNRGAGYDRTVVTAARVPASRVLSVGANYLGEVLVLGGSESTRYIAGSTDLLQGQSADAIYTLMGDSARTSRARKSA